MNAPSKPGPGHIEQSIAPSIKCRGSYVFGERRVRTRRCLQGSKTVPGILNSKNPPNATYPCLPVFGRGGHISHLPVPDRKDHLISWKLGVCLPGIGRVEFSSPGKVVDEKVGPGTIVVVVQARGGTCAVDLGEERDSVRCRQAGSQWRLADLPRKPNLRGIFQQEMIDKQRRRGRKDRGRRMRRFSPL